MTDVSARCYAVRSLNASAPTLLQAASRTAPRIDAHHHLWRYTPEEYGWIDDSLRALRRDFLLEDLRAELRTANVDSTVAVQARQTLAETEWLLELAAEPDSPLAGVVGWLPLASPDLEPQLDRLTGREALKGLRHVVQAEPAGFLDTDAFNRGIRTLRPLGLVYDILIFAPQLEEAARFVDRHPAQPFVLDHIAKPSIRTGEIKQWSAAIRELARRPHVTCKLSGMVTESDARNWSPAQLQPYLEVVLEAFGPERLMIGTDWPVLTVGCTYAQWWRTVEDWIAPLSPDEQKAILGGTAARVYNLPLSTEASEPLMAEAAAA